MDERQQEADYAVLQRLMLNLVQSRAGRSINVGEAWLNDAQTLARKMFEQLASLRTLTDVRHFQIDERHSLAFIDHSSVKVVARAAFETYLVFFFIFGGSDRSLSKFRHKIWRYAGLADRQKLNPTNLEARGIQVAEKEEMDRLKGEIEAAPHLQAYSRDAAKRILKGEWRGGESWANLSSYAGFHERYFRDTYGYLCGYSHASYISAMQVGQAQSLDVQRRLASMCIGIGAVLMAHFARAYAALFGDAELILDADREGQAAVSRWGFAADVWAKAIEKRSAF